MLSILAVGLILFGIKLYIDAPRDLGTRLEYIGRDDFGGCFLFYCEGSRGADYYFATNMTLGELKTYFKHAVFTSRPGGGGSSGKYSYIYLDFELTNDSDHFSLTYYDKAQLVREQYKLKPSTKANIISIGDFAYRLAKEALDE